MLSSLIIVTAGLIAVCIILPALLMVVIIVAAIIIYQLRTNEGRMCKRKMVQVSTVSPSFEVVELISPTLNSKKIVVIACFVTAGLRGQPHIKRTPHRRYTT